MGVGDFIDDKGPDKFAKFQTGASLAHGDPISAWLTNRVFGGVDGPSYDETISTGPAFQPRDAKSPGLQQGDNTGLEWMDTSKQGAQEQFVGQNLQGMTGPSASSAFNQQAQGFMGGPTASGQVNDSLQADPNFDRFYDRARERQAGGMNDQLAARGGYGSSAGLDMLSQGQSDINAAQANREADYMQQHQGQRIQAAGQADTAQQGLYGLGANAATAADSAGVSRFAAGANAAGGAQQARERRIGNFYDRGAAADANKANAAQPYQMGQIGADATGLGNSIALATGTTGEALNQSNQNLQQGFQYANAGVEGAGAALDMYKTAAGGM